MKKVWFFWFLALAASTAGGILLAPARSACFFVAMLATLCVFLITGIILATSADKESANSGLVGWPLSRICIGVVLMQMIIGLVFVLISDRTNWLIPAVVECIVLSIDAAALSPKQEAAKAEPSEEVAPASKEGPAE